ncbi:inhibitor of growth protein 3-like [Lineus longissimus]|uniref:inhibitor of growth protein 3-like n=1 Tax=Lineus longissimus TaxID=88925 RepID=UPI002B4D1198
MLYLEDYLEMIENLPMEMRERFTEMREMDLQVNNSMDSLDERIKSFFKKCLQPNVDADWKTDNFGKIKEDYYNALENADEKVQLANQIYELVDRHLRKLDQELQKFKMELEADNAGITEVLEKRSLELDIPQQAMNNHRFKERKHLHAALTNHVDKRSSTDKVLSSLANEAARETLTSHRSATSSPSVFTSNAPQSSLGYNVVQNQPSRKVTVGQMGAGSNAAIAAAASQAIAATQQMQQGRRTASLKASYEAMSKSSNFAQELLGGYAGAAAALNSEAPPPPAPTTSSSTSRSSRSSKKSSSKAAAAAAREAAAQQQQQQQQQQSLALTQPSVMPTTSQPTTQTAGTTGEGEVLEEAPAGVEWTYDPNEPRYCVCNQVSYGDMVGCDNDDCPIEWFHYGCVGLTQAPKGKWYCPQCLAAMKRRGRR